MPTRTPDPEEDGLGGPTSIREWNEVDWKVPLRLEKERGTINLTQKKKKKKQKKWKLSHMGK